MKILQAFIILILALIPFGELLRFSLGDTIVLKPLDLAIGAMTLVYLLLLGTRRVKVDKRYLTGFLLFSGVGLFSLLVNSSWLQMKEILAASLYLIRWLSYGVVLLAVINCSKKFKEKIIKYLLIDGVIITVIGFIQFIWLPSLKPYFAFGWDEHMYRLFSVFLDPNFAGAFFVLFFFFVVGLWYQNKKRWYLFLLVAIFLSLLLTFSRAALIMMLVSTAVFCLLMQKKKFFFMLLGAMLLFFVAVSPYFYLENVNPLRQASSVARIGNYTTAIVIILDKPFLGVGFNAYRYAKNHYGIQSGWSQAPSHADAGVDNSFLFVLATTGVVGLAAYLWLWWEILLRSWILYKKKSSVQACVIIASSVGLFMNALFINSLFFPACLLWIYFQIGLMEE